jgi:hypothetical protein
VPALSCPGWVGLGLGLQPGHAQQWCSAVDRAAAQGGRARAYFIAAADQRLWPAGGYPGSGVRRCQSVATPMAQRARLAGTLSGDVAGARSARLAGDRSRLATDRQYSGGGRTTRRRAVRAASAGAASARVHGDCPGHQSISGASGRLRRGARAADGAAVQAAGAGAARVGA